MLRISPAYTIVRCIRPTVVGFVIAAIFFLKLSASAQVQQLPTGPSDAIWIGENNGVKQLHVEDGNAFSAFPGDHLEDIAADPARGVVWVGTSQAIVQYAADGTMLFLFELPGSRGEHLVPGEVRGKTKRRSDDDDRRGQGDDEGGPGDRIHLSLDPSDGSLWASLDHRLIKLSFDHHVIFRADVPDLVQDLSVDISDSSCWMGTKDRIVRYSSDGQMIRSITIAKGNELRSLSADPSAGAVWVGTNSGLFKYDRSGALLFRQNGAADLNDLRADLLGAVWGITKNAVWKFGPDGAVLFYSDLCPGDRGQDDDGSNESHSQNRGPRGTDDRCDNDGDDRDGRGRCNGNLVALAVDSASGACFVAWQKEVLMLESDGAAARWYGGFKQIQALDIGLPRLAVTITAPGEGSVIEEQWVAVTGLVSDPIVKVSVNGQAAAVTGQTFELQRLPLMIGENRIVASATNLAHLTATDAITVTVPSSLPPLEIAIETPGQGDVTMNSRITVQGSVNDPTATVVVNGVQAGMNGMAFSAFDIPVALGENAITAYAVDPTGRTATDSITITYPWLELSIIYPFNGDLYPFDSTEVDVAVSDPGADVTVNGRSSDDYEDGVWYFSGIGLTEGWNEITAQAANQWGQVKEDTVHVRYQRQDSGPVSLDVLAPEDGATTDRPIFEIVGTVTDPDAEVIVNDVPAEVSDGLFRAVIHSCDENEIVPDAGWCWIVIRVYGSDGTTASLWRMYYYDPAEDPLRVALTQLPRGSIVLASPVAVSGTIHDPLGSIAPTEVTVNGVDAAIVGGTFTADVPVKDGKNMITVRAKDLLGHEAYDVASIIYEPPAKALAVQITSPVEGAVVNTASIPVSGLMNDSTAAVTVNAAVAARNYRSFQVPELKLVPGANMLTAVATRPGGGQAEASVRVTYDPAYPSPPVPHMTEIPRYSRSPYVDVTGLAQPLQLVEVIVNGAVQDVATADSQGLFKASVQLAHEGPHHVAARAVDNFGNRSSQSGESLIIRDTLPPPLSGIFLNIDSLNLRVSRVYVAGRTEPNADITIEVFGEPDATYHGKADNQGEFSPLFFLSAGKHAITISARDEAGNHSTSTRIYTVAAPDYSFPIPPQLDPLPSPMSESSIKVEGNAYAGFNVEVYRNNALMGTVQADPHGRFHLEGVTLVTGENRIRARQLADQIDKGPSFFYIKEAESPEVTVLQSPDSPTRQQVVVDFPKNGSVTNSPFIPVRGSVADGVNYVRLNGDFYGIETFGPVDSGRFRSYGIIPLTPGWNTLWVEAPATDGSRGVDKILVRYQPDGEVPSVTIASPTDESEVYDEFVPVQGTAFSGTTRLVVNETEIAPGSGDFDSTVDIFAPYTYRPAEYRSVITAWAMDEAGRIGSAEAHVRYKYVPVPTITVASPGNGMVMDTPSATLVGTVTDATEVWVNGRSALLSGNSFIHNVSLVYGQNRFNILAKNGPKAAGMTFTLYYYPGESSLQSISVYPPTVELPVGRGVQLTATAVYTSGLTAEVTTMGSWSIDNPIGEVENGYIKALRDGTTTITVRYGGVSTNIPLAVGTAGVDSLRIMYEKQSVMQTFYSYDDPRLALGATTRFLCAGMYPNGTLQDVTGVTTWKSSNTAVLDIDQWGRAEVRGAGTAVVTATVNDLTATVTTTVDPPPVYLFITAPADGSTLEGNEATVIGTILTGAAEAGVLVNGVPAAIEDGRFAANHVPVGEDGVITASATDTNGATMTAEVTVAPTASANPLRMAASIEFGTGPLETVLRIDGTIDDMMPEINYTGPGSVEFVACTTADSCKVKMTTPGVYFFTATVLGYDGSTYSAKIAIIVLDKAKLDALLQAKWEGMKTAFVSSDVAGGLDYFLDSSKESYRQAFNSIIDELPQVFGQMQSIELIYLNDRTSKYRIARVLEGVTFAFYIYFTKDDKGLWKIDRF